MCKFTTYTYACCGHSAIRYPFCTNPCPRYISFAARGLRAFKDSECPDTCLEEIVLSFACRDCKDHFDFRRLPNPETVPVRDFEGVWHIPETAARVLHLRTRDPWADDRRGDSSVAAERRRRERHIERSVCPKDASGSGAVTDKRTAQGGSDMKTVLRNLGAGLSEVQMTDLIVEHPRQAQGPSLGTGVMSKHR